MIWQRDPKPREPRPASRSRIYLWALLFCTLIAAIELPLPLEDVFRGLRNQLRARPADQSVVVVAYDIKTKDTLGPPERTRAHYATMLDQAFASGAKRVFFDEAFSQPQTPADDRALAAALARHSGRAFTGAMYYFNRATESVEPVLPDPLFRAQTPYRTLNGMATPLSLSAELVYGDLFEGRPVPSISSEISGRTGPAGEHFRPDWTVQIASVPTISFVDLVQGKVPASAIRGKDLIFGVTYDQADFFHLYGQGWYPGVYVHAVGAQTLKEGAPSRIGWIPPLLVAALLAAAILRTRRRRTANLLVGAAVTLGLTVPFLLDMALISADFISAFLLVGIVAYRARTLMTLNEARLRNASSQLPNLSALREEPSAAARPIIAMRIRNYAAVCASFSDEPVEDELVHELARRLTLPNMDTAFYQAEDVLYWLGPAFSTIELEDHLTGLARLIESQFELRGRKLDIHVTFGIDIDLDRPVPNRIGRALLAADNAAGKQQLMLFNTHSSDEDSAWELSLMSELDAAIDAGDIWLAYQPQFDLDSDAISGAEALVRWQHPTRGAISPETFVLPAESHNRIKRLTFHVLELAARSSRPLLELDPDFRLSVNLSASLLQHPHLPAQITQVLIATGFPASNLTLEVTESAPFSEHGIVATNLAGIAAIGIELSIDDYGTGNATLDYMRSVPCQEIKIDRRFVSGLTSSASDKLLVESTIELAHALGRRVIAEGIEDAETLDALRRIGCDVAQGYFLARPMRIDALEALIETGARTKAA